MHLGTLTNNCTLTAGNFLEVNTAERTITANGVGNALQYLNPGATNWEAFQAPPNPRTAKYELIAASASAAYLEAMYRSAYA